MRLYWPKKICLFISSKSKAKLNARRTRGSELLAPRVEDEGLHHALAADREFLQQHALLGHGREIVARSPSLGAVLGAPVDIVALERLERDGGVAEILEAHLVEVVAADVDVEVLAPIVLHALVNDRAAGDELLDPVGATAERRLEPGGADVALVAVRCRCLPTSASAARRAGRRSAAARGCPAVEGECDFALAGLLGLGHVPVVGRVLRVMLLERLQREDHVVDGDRLAVVPARSARSR